MKGSSIVDRGFLIWFTGVPAAGKSTVAGRVERTLREMGL
ncbi:MAG: adenylyl-sulfate kinase, partial [Armatimonadota bacterium]